MKILVAADGSEYTRRMLAYLAAHDEWLGSAHDYTVVTVVPAVPARAAKVLDASLLSSYYRDEAEKVFKPIRSFFTKQGLKGRFVDKTGVPSQVLAKLLAGDKFDLLVMGSHGHSALGNLVMGSVTTQVLAGCKTPVLLIR